MLFPNCHKEELAFSSYLIHLAVHINVSRAKIHQIRPNQQSNLLYLIDWVIN